MRFGYLIYMQLFIRQELASCVPEYVKPMLVCQSDVRPLWISAVALQHGLPLYSKDRHFEWVAGLILVQQVHTPKIFRPRTGIHGSGLWALYIKW